MILSPRHSLYRSSSDCYRCYWVFGTGIPLGIIAALRHNTIVDHAATFFAVAGVSVPNLVLGPLLILIFGVSLQWLPIAFWGADPPFILGFLPRPTAQFWLHAVMPVVALGTGSAAGVARLTRAGLLEVLNEDYIRTARAKGLRETCRYYRPCTEKLAHSCRHHSWPVSGRNPYRLLHYRTDLCAEWDGASFYWERQRARVLPAHKLELDLRHPADRWQFDGLTSSMHGWIREFGSIEDK